MTSGQWGAARFGLPASYSRSPTNSGKSLPTMEAKTHRWDLLSLHRVTLTEYELSAKWKQVNQYKPDTKAQYGGLQ